MLEAMVAEFTVSCAAAAVASPGARPPPPKASLPASPPAPQGTAPASPGGKKTKEQKKAETAAKKEAISPPRLSRCVCYAVCAPPPSDGAVVLSCAGFWFCWPLLFLWKTPCRGPRVVL